MVEKPPPGSPQKEKIMQPFLTQYQSANLSDEQIIDNFVVRTKEFERVMADIRTTEKGSSFQHYVFVGRRGSGKSTLLRRIQAEVCTDPELKEEFIVANLSEEQAGIYKLYDLWDYVMRDLRAKGFDLLEIDWQQYQDDLKEYTKILYRTIHEFLKKEDKRLILLVDNIDRIFKNIGKDANLLREQLMNFNDVRIIGGSTVMAEDFWRYDMPFYQFFSIKRLEPLSMEEIKMLLEHWAVARGNPEIAQFVEQHPGKIQAVRMLTDGTPRTMQLFVDMLINRDDQQGFDYLRSIIDNATPIYQERLGQLSQQQQKIVTELSFFWEAASVEQLVPVCKMSGKNISAQMAQLVKAAVVEKILGSSKKNLYRVEDRSFNLWLLLTQSIASNEESVQDILKIIEDYYNVVSEQSSHWVDRRQKLTQGSTGDTHIFEANEAPSIYNWGVMERRSAPFRPTINWNDPQEEAIKLYTENGDSETALLRIQESLEFHSFDLGLLVIQNILQLWAGKMDCFAIESRELMARINTTARELVPSYMTHLLIHKQLHIVLEFLLQNQRDHLEMRKVMPFYYAILFLQNAEDPKLLRMPPELAQVVSDIVANVQERQEFYYGK
jgi:AAA ATPase domain